jgi:hypothetical protein
VCSSDLNDALVYADALGRPIAAVGSPAEAAAARRRGLLVVSLPRYAAAGAMGKLPALPPELLAPPGSDVMPAAAAAGIAGALQLAAQLRRLRPAWTTALSQIDVVDEDDYQLRVEGLPCPLLVRGSRLADNLVRFDQLLPELRRRYQTLANVDLRFSRRIVVQAAHVAPPIQPAQAVKPVPPAPAAKTMAPPAPAAPTSSRGSDNF